MPPMGTMRENHDPPSTGGARGGSKSLDARICLSVCDNNSSTSYSCVDNNCVTQDGGQIPSYILIATLFGPELPSLVGAFIGLAIVIFAAKRGFLMPKKNWDFPDASEWADDWKSTVDMGDVGAATMSLVKAWTPYALIAIILVVTRIPSLGLKSLLASQVITIKNVMGMEGLNYGLKWAYLPGTIPFILVALITHFIHGMKGEEVKMAELEQL